jgi:hypothetical protein
MRVSLVGLPRSVMEKHLDFVRSSSGTEISRTDSPDEGILYGADQWSFALRTGRFMLPYLSRQKASSHNAINRFTELSDCGHRVQSSCVESRYDMLPPIHLAQVKRLAPSDAPRLWALILEADMLRLGDHVTL